jgi:hypothetical protein
MEKKQLKKGLTILAIIFILLAVTLIVQYLLAQDDEEITCRLTRPVNADIGDDIIINPSTCEVNIRFNRELKKELLEARG